MIYEGHESYTFFKDNEEDMKEYKNLNIERLKQQGFILSENKRIIQLKRVFHLNRQLPVIDAEYKELYEENPVEE